MDAPRSPDGPTIRWVKPTIPLPDRQPAAFARHKATPTARLLASTPPDIRDVLLRQGVPEYRPRFPFFLSAKQEAIHLLKLAAEVEQALMVQYLYAYASLQGTTPYDKEVKNKIRMVAVQEMGHLISVQNLLLAIGGPAAFYFGRDGIRAKSLDRPIPLVLEPVSLKSLAKYVVAEMPASVTDPTRKKQVQDIVKLVEADGIAPHRVGTLYTKLFWLFQPSDAPLAPFNLTPVPGMLEAGRHIKPSDFTPPDQINQFKATYGPWVQGSVTGFLLEDVTDSTSACKLLAKIAEQGEGQLDTEESHFEDFLAIYTTLQAQLNPSPGSPPPTKKLTVTPLPTSPVASTLIAPDAQPGSPITNAYLKAWADLSDIRYNLLITTLWQTMATPAATRGTALDVFYQTMHLLADITQRMLKIRDRLGDKSAGPPYALKYDYLKNPFAQRYQELLKAQGELIKKIRADAQFVALDNSTLQNIENSSVLPTAA